MASIMKEFEHLKIQLKELKEATNNFGSKVIGAGGFGKVYEGNVLHSKGRSIVAIKRLNRQFGQGDLEFWKEVMMLSRYTHKNLISLLGYCDEDGEKILVYEHAYNGSLDRYISSMILTWAQRLKICLDVAKGLAYLHDHKGTQQRIIHRDIKSANILLDDNWNAKLGDMGLSKVGPANQEHTFLFTNVVGTPGYCDPQYMTTYSLTKESDIYSLGVVLFEVISGKLCYKYTNDRLEVLVPRWKQFYQEKRLDEIIFKDLGPHIDPTSLTTFSEIAFQCLHNSREQRPMISLLVEKLGVALEFQEAYDKKLEERFLNMGEVVGEGGRLVHCYGNVYTDGFTATQLRDAQAKYTGENIYGTDYKATFENGDRFCLKVLEQVTENQREFEFELYKLGKIRHLNLLALKAYYLGPNGDNLLAFDYMPNGSLADYLHVGEPGGWATRMQIAKGVARGLLTLQTNYKMIHGNLTSSNVFLDETLNPKISDYGLSPYYNVISPERVFGYQAPEYLLHHHKPNEKAYVYSMGMIILELLTGKSPGETIKGLVLPQWVAEVMKNGQTAKVFDHKLMKGSYVGEMSSSLQLALDCLSLSARDRPDMLLILQKLERITPVITSVRNDIYGDG